VKQCAKQCVKQYVKLCLKLLCVKLIANVKLYSKHCVSVKLCVKQSKSYFVG